MSRQFADVPVRCGVHGVLYYMDNDIVIQLSGPFRAMDSQGRLWDLHGIRIFNEGYGIIDVYVDFVSSMEDEPLHEDPLLIAQILSRLRSLGYTGPDFGPGDPGLQDDMLIVLEAPEEFNRFAAGKGWKNLAEQYADDHTGGAAADDILGDAHSRTEFLALMRKLRVR